MIPRAGLTLLLAQAGPKAVAHPPPPMPNYLVLEWMAAITGLLFIFAFGAIVGSFLNVVVYRVPKGLGLVSPPSSCPSCETRLTWRENFPILGWLALGGRCRFCRSKISPEYPLIETLTAVLFAAIFFLWFMQSMVPPSSVGPLWQSWQPEWARAGLVYMWPMLAMVFCLVASLIAITLIDARTFTIPLSIPWVATLVGFIGHPLHALALTLLPGAGRAVSHLHSASSGQPWTIPTPTGGWLAASIGGAVGIGLSSLLVALGVMPRSFADYDEWEAKHTQPAEPASPRDGQSATSIQPDEPKSPHIKEILVRTFCLVTPAVALMFAGALLGASLYDAPLPGLSLGMMVGLVIGFILRNLVARSARGDQGPIWLEYPHARREMLWELLFLAPCLMLAWLGYWLATPHGPPGGVHVGVFEGWFQEPALWLRALGGSLLGYLVGGGIVWGLRLLGTLGMGQEAMGLGDVHLMAAVGAVLGWVDPAAAFIIAPASGLSWTIGVWAFRRWHRGTQGPALPYGPHLAAATVVVILLHPLLVRWLADLPGGGIAVP